MIYYFAEPRSCLAVQKLSQNIFVFTSIDFTNTPLGPGDFLQLYSIHLVHRSKPSSPSIVATCITSYFTDQEQLYPLHQPFSQCCRSLGKLGARIWNKFRNLLNWTLEHSVDLLGNQLEDHCVTRLPRLVEKSSEVTISTDFRYPSIHLPDQFKSRPL